MPLALAPTTPGPLGMIAFLRRYQAFVLFWPATGEKHIDNPGLPATYLSHFDFFDPLRSTR